MKELERRLQKLEADVKKANAQKKAEERAREINEEYPKTVEIEKKMYEVRCGNCNSLWSYSESYLLSRCEIGWRYCPMCGVKIKGVE